MVDRTEKVGHEINSHRLAKEHVCHRVRKVACYANLRTISTAHFRVLYHDLHVQNGLKNGVTEKNV